MLVGYATGDRARLLARVGEAEAVEIALADLRRLFPGADPKHRLLDARRIDWSADPFAGGGYTFLRLDARGARRRLAAADTGALFWAGSATESAPIADTVEAAYASGLRAAREVRAHLEAPLRARTEALASALSRASRRSWSCRLCSSA